MDRNNNKQRHHRDGRERSRPQNLSSGTNSGRGGGRGRPGRGRGQTYAEHHQNVQMTRQNVTAPFQTQQQPMGGFNTPQPFVQGQPFGFGGGGQQQPPPNQPFGGFGAYPPPTNQHSYWGATQTGFAPQMAFGASWPLNTTNVPMLTNSIQSGPAAMDVDSTPPATTRETPAKRSDRRAREQREEYNPPLKSRDKQASQRRPQDRGRDPRDRSLLPRLPVERKREPATKSKGKQRVKDDDIVSPEIRAAHRRQGHILAVLQTEGIELSLATAVMDNPGAQIVVGQLTDTIEDLRCDLNKVRERNQALTGQLAINTRKRPVQSPSVGTENGGSRISMASNVEAKRQRCRSPHCERSISQSVASTRDQAPHVVDDPSETQEEEKSSGTREITVTMPGPVPPSPIMKEPNPPNDTQSAPSDADEECSDEGVIEVSDDEDTPNEHEMEHKRGQHMVRNEKRAKRRMEIEKREVDRLDRLPGPIPDAIGVIYRGNQTKRDNSFAGALSSSVYHSPRSNIVFAGDMAVAAATYELNNPQRTYAPLSGSKLYKQAPRGFPMNQKEVKKLFSLVRNKYNHLEDCLEGYLIIEEFYWVSRAFVDTQRDRAMELVANNPLFHPHELPPMADENPHLLPTQPVPRDTSFRTAGKTSQKKGMGLSAPLAADTFNILEWARYIAIYHRPGNSKPIHGIAMNRAFHVELQSVFGYLLMKSMCPITPQARTAWTRQVACVVARPQAYREAVTVWESQHPEEQFSEVNPTLITLR
ncbi:hypothetical protein BDZ94DRAFT_1312702 [Collybia nuda]|uniref:Uncharacterized protein n=1 Tax=Collybia nuda TaxID=64659 RepID=A0A9P5XWK9_9AGAR|nr:hypothetical protein BDZ94DRAFT_1312702 [Collybia nuda]